MTERIAQVLDEVRDRARARHMEIHALRRRLIQGDAVLAQLDKEKREAYAAGVDASAIEQTFAARAAQALEALGQPADALEYRPECPICADEGYVGGRLCACVVNEAARRGMHAGLAREEIFFDQFDPQVFPADAPMENGYTQRDYMLRLKEVLEAFCAEYPAAQYTNVILTGKSGLGKTFLLKCMASELSRRGVPVLLSTAYRVNEQMARSMAGQADITPFLDTDVLFIDDLGAEPLFRTTTQNFFHLFNERLEGGKTTIVTTNLSTAELRARYEERTYSRLVDQRHARVLPLMGADIRRIKAKGDQA